MNITRIEYSPCEEHGTKGCLYCTGGADSRLGHYKARVAELEAELATAQARIAKLELEGFYTEPPPQYVVTPKKP